MSKANSDCLQRKIKGKKRSFVKFIVESSSMKVKVFVLEIYKDGKRKIWPEALPAKTAFEAAKTLARDGFKPVIIRLDLTREQYMQFDPQRIVIKLKAS